MSTVTSPAGHTFVVSRRWMPEGFMAEVASPDVDFSTGQGMNARYAVEHLLLELAVNLLWAPVCMLAMLVWGLARMPFVVLLRLLRVRPWTVRVNGSSLPEPVDVEVRGWQGSRERIGAICAEISSGDWSGLALVRVTEAPVPDTDQAPRVDPTRRELRRRRRESSADERGEGIRPPLARGRTYAVLPGDLEAVAPDRES